MAAEAPAVEDKCMPIAIIGMACRFPGDATSPENLWQMLAEGRSAWSEIPQDRLNVDGFYHPGGERQGTINFKGGHFLKDDVAAWDAPFFSMTAQEAAAMDPQQRYLLEVSYEALENAGVRMESLPGSPTAVYCGSFVKDYEQVCLRDPDDSPMYAATGNGIAIMSNRVSWFYDLRGPSMTIDTGCSASLVGVSLACQNLRLGESKMAIAMGAGMILTPATMLPMTSLGFLSSDGKCFTFDSRANGYGRGEGIGAVILKPLADALRDNDTIRAVIRGSGINQDGRTPGITMPSMEAQAANIRAVYDRAGLGYEQTAYFEAHGTGTQAGDPIELGAIGETFALARTQTPMHVGSVKTNIGHLEGCAGIAGLIKSVMMLEKGVIPPHLWLEKVNPRILLDDWNIKIPKELTHWPLTGLRRISVNCFGFGGTNSHVIIDDAYHYLKERRLRGKHYSVSCGSSSPSVVDSGVDMDASSDDDSMLDVALSKEHPRIFVLSSHEQSGISRLTETYSAYLASKTAEQHLDFPSVGTNHLEADLAYTLGQRRSVLPWKSYVVASSAKGLLSSLKKGQFKTIRSSQPPTIAFIFSGQGAQWHAMGRELMLYDCYVQSLHSSDEYLKSIGCEWSLMEELSKDAEDTRIDRPYLSQPLCTALQIALVDLLDRWCIKPKAVVGHSSGEIAAAYCAGALSREDAMMAAYHRGRLTESLGQLAPQLKGKMIAVALPQDEAEQYIGRVTSGELIVACINSPSNVTVSGDATAIHELERLLKENQVFARVLKVENAYHSSHMRVIEEAYCDSIRSISTLHPNIKMFSSVTGALVPGEDLGAAYWAKNLVSPVRFSEAVQELLSSKGKHTVRPDVLLEIGPHATLQSPLQQILDAQPGQRARPETISMLYRGKDATITTLNAAGLLWTHGAAVALREVNEITAQDPPRVLPNLPPYPWNHSKKYWHESHLGKENRFRKFGRQDLIGAPTADSIEHEPRWRGFIRQSENPWVQDHQVQNTMLYPASGMLAMVLEAAQQIQDISRTMEGYELTNVKIGKAMIIPPTANGLETALNMKRREHDGMANTASCTSYDFTIYSWSAEQSWQSHCTGTLHLLYTTQAPDISTAYVKSLDNDAHKSEYAAAKDMCRETVAPRQLYESLESIGLKYGPLFQNITAIRKKDNISCTTIRIPDTLAKMPHSFEYPHFIHPATLDALFQTVFVSGSEPMLPSAIDSIYFAAEIPHGAGSELIGHTKAIKHGLREAIGTVVMSDKDWETPRIIINGFHCTSLLTDADAGLDGFLPNNHKLSAQLTWEKVENPVPEGASLDSPEIVIIQPDHPSSELAALVSELDARLGDLNTTANVSTLRSGSFNGKLCIMLDELDASLIANMSQDDFDSVKLLVSAAQGCLWLTCGSQIETANPKLGAVNGLFRTIRSEEPQKALYSLDLDADCLANPVRSVGAIISMLKASFSANEQSAEHECAERNGEMFVPRLTLEEGLNTLVERGTASAPAIPMPLHQDNRALKLEVGSLGRLETLRFNDDEDSLLPLEPDQVDIKVKAAGLALSDVQTALGQTTSDSLGFDASGVISAVGSDVTSVKVGDRVAVYASGALKSSIRSHSSMVQVIPSTMSFETAASLPSVFMVAYQSLINVARLKKGDSVLIHNAAGGVGQAAIQIALHVGASIFATVSSPEKQSHLTKVYGIPPDNILDSRSAFAKGIKRLTQGNGVDVVLNTLLGEGQKQSWKCVSEMGRFIQIGKQESLEPASISSASALQNISFTKIDLESMFKRTTAPVSSLLESIFQLFAESAISKVDPVSVFPFSEVSEAFKSLQSPQHMGKVVLQALDHDLVPVVPRDPHPLALKGDATYLLVGGLGGLGRSLARLMVEHGARNIAFLSRSGDSKAEAKMYLDSLLAEGITAKAYRCDITDLASLQGAIASCAGEMPPISGAVQAAAVVQDGIFDNMTWESWVAATKPKIDGSWNLHLSLPKDMDFFICLSSSTGIIGARGQANYATGNVFQDALCHHRRSQGLAGVSLDLGMILGAGMVAEDEKTLDMLRASGFFGIREEDFLLLAKCAMAGYSVDSHPVPPQVIVGTGTGGLVLQNDLSDPYWFREAKFSILKAVDMPSDSANTTASSIKDLLSNAPSVDDATTIVNTGIVTLLAKALNIAPEDIDAAKPANAYGVDSLVAVGTRNWIFKETGVDCSVFEILSEVGIRDLSLSIVSKSRFVSKEVLEELEAEA